MQRIQRFFDFYIFSNIHVGFATFSLVKITLLLYGNADNALPFFVFFSTVLSYNFIRFYRRKTMQGFFAIFFKTYQVAISVLCGIAFLGMCYFGIQLKYPVVVSLLPFFLLTIFYVLPLKFLSKSSQSLRTISGIKIVVIALCWAGVTVVVPAVYMKLPISLEILGVFVQRLLFVLAITIPFDVRDLSYDAASLKTIPQLLGIARAKRFGLVLLILFLGLSIWLNAEDPQRLRIEFFIALVSLLFLVRSREDQHAYYSAFFVEAIPILWMGLVYFLIP